MSKGKNLATLERGKVQLIKAVGAAIDNLNRTCFDLANQLEVLRQRAEAQEVVPVSKNCGKKRRLRNSTRLIRFVVGTDPVPLVVKGRVAWCLKELLIASDFGITGCRGRGRRLAAYIHTLRKRYGLEIETELEPHGGPYPGRHARYRLWSEIKVLRDTGASR